MTKMDESALMIDKRSYSMSETKMVVQGSSSSDEQRDEFFDECERIRVSEEMGV